MSAIKYFCNICSEYHVIPFGARNVAFITCPTYPNSQMGMPSPMAIQFVEEIPEKPITEEEVRAIVLEVMTETNWRLSQS